MPVGGAGNNGARKYVRPFSLLNIARREQGISVAITDRMAAWRRERRERRVLRRVSRAAWRLEQAERERSWALVSARVEGIESGTFWGRLIAAGLPAGARPQTAAGRLRKARAAASAAAGVSAVAESEPLADDLAGQVQDCRVVVQDESGVGGQQDNK